MSRRSALPLCALFLVAGLPGSAIADGPVANDESSRAFLELGWSLRVGYATYHGRQLPRDHAMIFEAALLGSLGPVELDASLTAGAGTGQLIELGLPLILHLTPSLSRVRSGAFVGAGVGGGIDNAGPLLRVFAVAGWRQYLSEGLVFRVEARAGDHGDEDETYAGPYALTAGFESVF